MGQAIPQRHPAVVLRTHYDLVRALLAVTLVALVCLAVAVAIIVADDAGERHDERRRAGPAGRSAGVASAAGRCDAAYLGGVHALRRRPRAVARRRAALRSPTTRFDGGPEEGTRGAVATASPTSRFDGGPEEGSAGR